MASGKCAHPWNEEHNRTVDDFKVQVKYAATENVDKTVVDRIEEIAKRRGIPLIQVSLAWLLSKPAVAAPIVDFTDHDRIETTVWSVDVTLHPEEITYLEKLYVPHKVVGAFTRGVQNVTSSK